MADIDSFLSAVRQQRHTSDLSLLMPKSQWPRYCKGLFSTIRYDVMVYRPIYVRPKSDE